MKFKVGDKVRVTGRAKTSTAVGKDKYIGRILTILKIFQGMEFPYSTDDKIYYWSEDELELVETSFTKSDLKYGMVVEHKNGVRRMFLNNIFIGFDSCALLNYYTDTLENIIDDREHSALTIDKVYISSAVHLQNYFDDDKLTLVWERKEKSRKEMTVEDIEKELGYKIKIVPKNEKG